MTLTIGGLNHTETLQQGSLVIRHYGTLRSSFRATLFFRKTPRNFPKAGQEILVKQGDDLLWGGILVETEQVCHSTDSFTLLLRGQGYEQILQRFCLPGIHLQNQTPSQAARTIFQTYLNPVDSLVLGAVEDGVAPAYPYTFSPAKASTVFDHLAKENGFMWWIDKDKKFYMRPEIPYKNADYTIDLQNNPSTGLRDIQTFIFRQSTADYKNEQIVYNRNNGIEGKHRHMDRLSEMASRYGSGEYGASISNQAVTTQDQAQSVAKKILSYSPGLGEIEFTTDQKGFGLGQNLKVIAPVCGINSTQNFCITEISAVYLHNRFRYTVTAKETDGKPLSIARWENLLAGNRIR